LTIVRILVTGASGQLGCYLIDRLSATRHHVSAWSGTTRRVRGEILIQPVDLAEGHTIAAALAEADPDVIIHAAALSSTESAWREPALARAVNVAGTECLAEWAEEHDRRLVYTSSDLVFDGSNAWNREDDPALPILEYGRTKREAELAVLARPRGLVARLSLLYGPSRCGRTGYFDRTMATMRGSTPQWFFADEFRTPLDLATAAAILVRLAESQSTGLIHVGGPERLSRFELARRTASVLGIDPSLARANRRADVATAEPRPADVSLDTSRLRRLFPDLEIPQVEDALAGGRGAINDP
jgi:dTDP-4-dehydrorhamnose reductase